MNITPVAMTKNNCQISLANITLVPTGENSKFTASCGIPSHFLPTTATSHRRPTISLSKFLIRCVYNILIDSYPMLAIVSKLLNIVLFEVFIRENFKQQYIKCNLIFTMIIKTILNWWAGICANIYMLKEKRQILKNVESSLEHFSRELHS